MPKPIPNALKPKEGELLPPPREKSRDCITGKVAFDSKKNAATAANSSAKRHRSSGRQRRMEAYHCHHCNRWHLSSID